MRIEFTNLAVLIPDLRGSSIVYILKYSYGPGGEMFGIIALYLERS